MSKRKEEETPKKMAYFIKTEHIIKKLIQLYNIHLSIFIYYLLIQVIKKNIRL